MDDLIRSVVLLSYTYLYVDKFYLSKLVTTRSSLGEHRGQFVQ